MLIVYLHFFFFNDTATTEIYTLSLHDALPISRGGRRRFARRVRRGGGRRGRRVGARHVNEKGPSAPFFQPGFCKEQGMTEISAGMVKELREMTGLGMMECKKALAEAGGDLRKAEELLRIKSGAKASKAASRVAAEGVIGAYLSPDAKLGALVELNCETDFVAKNDEFLAFAQSLAETVATQNPRDRKSTRLNSSHGYISYAVFCLKKKKKYK